jgi:hypothetical protein
MPEAVSRIGIGVAEQAQGPSQCPDRNWRYKNCWHRIERWPPKGHPTSTANNVGIPVPHQLLAHYQEPDIRARAKSLNTSSGIGKLILCGNNLFSAKFEALVLDIIFDNLGIVLVSARVVKNTVCNSPSNQPTKELKSLNSLVSASMQFYMQLIIKGEVAMFEKARSETRW